LDINCYLLNMPTKKPTIQIPEEGGVKIDPGAKIDSDFKKIVKRRFDKIDALLFAIVASVVVSVIAIIISVLGIFIDQLRYNNAAYKDYSEKVQSVEQTQKSNDILLKQTDLQQKQIIDLQKQIQGLLNK
jgi:hypothetical protein